jgi:hypothetical protein
MRLFLTISIALFLTSCSSEQVNESAPIQEEKTLEVKQVPPTTNEADYSKSVFYTDSIGWGYEISKNSKPFINQPHIPAVPGNVGFKTESDALKLADFVIHKLENGIVPPTVSLAELDSLKLID